VGIFSTGIRLQDLAVGIGRFGASPRTEMRIAQIPQEVQERLPQGIATPLRPLLVQVGGEEVAPVVRQCPSHVPGIRRFHSQSLPGQRLEHVHIDREAPGRGQPENLVLQTEHLGPRGGLCLLGSQGQPDLVHRLVELRRGRP